MSMSLLSDGFVLARLEALRSGFPAKIDRAELCQNSSKLAKARILKVHYRKVKSRVKILRQVSLFKDMPEVDLQRAAGVFTEVMFEPGQAVVRQGEIGDEFFIVSSGFAKVWYSNAQQQEDKLLATIGANKFFGELALLTEEPRNATIKAAEDVVEPLVLMKMTRKDFQSLFSTEKQAVGAVVANSANLRERKAWEVVSNLPLFAAMDDGAIREMVVKMKTVKYQPGTYIVNEGQKGRSFYIILEGLVKVTVNDPEYPNTGRAIGELCDDDYFGEVALLSKDHVRTANVLTLTPCVCFTLDRDFFSEAQAVSNIDEVLRKQAYFTRFESQGLFRQDERPVVGEDDAPLEGRRERWPRRLFGRLLREMIKSLGQSLITNIFKGMCLGATHEYGSVFRSAFVACHSNRASFQRRVRALLLRLANNKKSRGFNELAMIRALWEQSTDALDVHFADWPAAALLDVARYTDVRFLNAGSQLYDVNAQKRATRAYMVVRGTVAIKRTEEGVAESKAVPGSFIWGEAFDEPSTAKRVNLRHRCVAVTNCVVFSLDYRDYFKVAEHMRSGAVFDVEEKYDLVESMPLFAQVVDPEHLYLVAYALQEHHLSRGSILIREGETANSIFFLRQGSLTVHADCSSSSTPTTKETTTKDDSSSASLVLMMNASQEQQQQQVLPPALGPNEEHPVAGITLATLHRGEYVGESGVLSTVRKRTCVEQVTYCAKTDVELYVLRPDKYNLLEQKAVARLEENHRVRAAWRKARSKTDPFANHHQTSPKNNHLPNNNSSYKANHHHHQQHHNHRPHTTGVLPTLKMDHERSLTKSYRL